MYTAASTTAGKKTDVKRPCASAHSSPEFYIARKLLRHQLIKYFCVLRPPPRFKKTRKEVDERNGVQGNTFADEQVPQPQSHYFAR